METPVELTKIIQARVLLRLTQIACRKEFDSKLWEMIGRLQYLTGFHSYSTPNLLDASEQIANDADYEPLYEVAR